MGLSLLMVGQSHADTILLVSRMQASISACTRALKATLIQEKKTVQAEEETVLFLESVLAGWTELKSLCLAPNLITEMHFLCYNTEPAC